MQQEQVIYLAQDLLKLDITFQEPTCWFGYINDKRPFNKLSKALAYLWYWTHEKMSIDDIVGMINAQKLEEEACDILLGIKEDPNKLQKELYDRLNGEMGC